MIKTILVDGDGRGNKVSVNSEGALYTVAHPHPPKTETDAALPFRQYLTDDGTSTGTVDMRVDGSTNNVMYCVTASPDYDIYIRNIAVVIADQNAVLNKFGNITALTNGVEFSWISQDLGDIVIADSLKSNFDFVQLALGQPAFGDGTAAFRAGNIVGASEGYIPNIDLSKTFGLPWGVRLRQGTKDMICFTVKDDVTLVDRFDAVCYGIRF